MTIERLKYDSYYFKQAANKMFLMSGFPLPNYNNGVVSNVDFVNCDFHYDCQDVVFENCSFKDCHMPWKRE